MRRGCASLARLGLRPILSGSNGDGTGGEFNCWVHDFRGLDRMRTARKALVLARFHHQCSGQIDRIGCAFLACLGLWPILSASNGDGTGGEFNLWVHDFSSLDRMRTDRKALELARFHHQRCGQTDRAR